MPLAMGQVTHLLHEWRAGSRDAENRLFELVLPDLRRLARYLMKGERKDHSLEPTELVGVRPAYQGLKPRLLQLLVGTAEAMP